MPGSRVSETTLNRDVALARSAVAVAVRRHDPAAERQARRALAEARIADFINKTVDAAPPLTTEQRDRLVAILRGAEK